MCKIEQRLHGIIMSPHVKCNPPMWHIYTKLIIIKGSCFERLWRDLQKHLELLQRIFIYPVVCYLQARGYHAYVLWVQNAPPLWPTQTAQTIWHKCDLTLQSVNRWRHNEYSCCSHPSRSYICKAHLLSRSDQWSDGQTWKGNMLAFYYEDMYIINSMFVSA